MNILYSLSSVYIWQWILIGLAFIIAMFAQSKVQGTYQKYKQIQANTSLTGADIARKILEAHGIHDVEVVPGHGAELSDFYDPQNKIVSLSSNIYHTNSIAAVSVAAHEVGHAIQHATNYQFIAIRNRLLPSAIVASNLSIFLILIGSFFFQTSFGLGLLWFGIGLYGIIGLFQLVTLPVEFDASKRGLANLQQLNLISETDMVGAKKMLNAAAFTYVAAFLGTILTILRFVLMALSSSSRRRD